MDDLAKKDSKVHLNQTSVATSNNFMADLMANPKEFIAQVAHLDPVELRKIIALLDALKGTSEAREAHLVDVLNNKNDEAVITGNAVVAAQTAVTDAQTVVTNAEGAVVDAQTAVTNAKAIEVVKQQELTSANTAHATKLGEKDAAQKTHNDEIPSLNDEQQVLSDVIDMLEELHSKQEGIWVKGGKGSVCNDVCGAIGKTCNPDEPSKLTTYALLVSAFKKAGYTCNGEQRGGKDYPSTPFETSDGFCYWMLPGGKSVCDKSSFRHYSPLCYCD